MNYVSIFRHPSKGVYHHSCGGASLRDETECAKRFNGDAAFGVHLHSRPVRQMPLRTNTLYQLRLSQGLLQYRSVDEQMFAPLDCFRTHGAHRDEVTLLVEQRVLVPELGIKLPVCLEFKLSGISSTRFRDLCNGHLFQVELKDGKASLAGFKSACHDHPEVMVPLEIVTRAALPAH